MNTELPASNKASFAVPRVGRAATFMNTARLEADFGKGDFEFVFLSRDGSV